MRKRLVAPVALVVALTVCLASTASAQEPSLSTVLARAAAYVAEFQRHLSGMVAEESYAQEAHTSTAVPGMMFRRDVEQHRQLKSDLLLVRPAGADRYVEFRDVFEVDGAPVRDRQERLSALFLGGAPSAAQQIQQITTESARYNIGRIERTINTPTLPLLFLDPEMQPRFAFSRAADGARPARAADKGSASPRFEVGTELWVVAYQETQRHTLIQTTTGRDLPARGRFWIDPSSGRVVMTELVAANPGVRAVVDVSYESDPVDGFTVPIEMRERYDGLLDGSLIEGVATYGRFRRFQVTVDERIPPPTP